jgi:hypothetical protein
MERSERNVSSMLGSTLSLLQFLNLLCVGVKGALFRKLKLSTRLMGAANVLVLTSLSVDPAMFSWLLREYMAENAG